MKLVMGSYKLVCNAAFVAVSSLGACVPTVEMMTPNAVSYDVDGVNVVVEDGLSFAVMDQTKHLLGPNTYLYMEAGVRSSTPDEVLGDKLRFNVPVGTSVGTYDVRFTPLPGRDSVWLSYRSSESASWSAYRGTVTLDQLDGIGGRMSAHFSEVDLIDSCGQMRQLTNGSIDVRVGSEDVFPVSAIDMSDTSEWAQLGAPAVIENNLIVEMDGKLIACPFIDFGPTIIPAAYSGTGRDEEVLEMNATCGCDHDGPEGTRPPSFGVSAQVPISGDGVVVDDVVVPLLVTVDVNGTPGNFADDEMWLPSTAPRLRYKKSSSDLGASIDIELAMPLTLYNFDKSAPIATKSLSVAHMYGVVNRSLGQRKGARGYPSSEDWPVETPAKE